MEFALAFTKNRDQLILKTFNLKDQSTESKILNFDDAKAFGLQGLIYDPEIPGEDFMGIIESELKFYPIRAKSDFSLSPDSFADLNCDEGKKIFDRLRDNWVLQNNLSLVEEIFKTRSHLLSLYPNDRSSFFEELWFILKSNLGALEINMIYNDLIKGKTENEKNKLVKVKVIGDRYPELTSVDEADEAVLKSYEKDFGNIFEITDFNKEKGHLVICASIKKSPVFIMASVSQLTRIQKAVLASLFEGLNLA
jgi:uncharacterized pyridoxamine 5'-phosphate oxidase family protein